MFQVYAVQHSWRADWAEGAVGGGAVDVEQQASSAVRARVQRGDDIIHDAQLNVRRQDLEVVLQLHCASVTHRERAAWVSLNFCRFYVLLIGFHKCC